MQHSSDSPTAVRLKQQLSQVLDLEDEQLRGVPIPTLHNGGARLFAEGGAASSAATAREARVPKLLRRCCYYFLLAGAIAGPSEWMQYDALAIMFVVLPSSLARSVYLCSLDYS